MLSYVPNHSKHSKTTKVIKLRWIASIWRQNDQKCLVTSQTIQNNSNLQKYSNYNELHRFDVKNIKQRKTTKSDQITTKCMDLTSKRTKMFCYIGNHSKQRKSTKVIKVQWSAWIWRQNEQKCWVTSQTIQNNSNLQKYSNYNELHRFDVKNIKQRKTTKVIKLRLSAWIWRQNEQKCFVTSETIQNNAKLQKWSNYDELHRFDVKTIKNVELRPKPFKTTQTTKVFKLQWIASIWCQKHQTTQNYKSDQITMKCMDLTSKRTKMFSYVTSETIQNNANLQKLSKYNEVHGFDVKTNKNVELRRKPFKTTQI